VFSNDWPSANYYVNAAAPDMFNALLFVEKTTATRKIAPAESNRW
jgi:hypothetical protein